MKHIVYNAVQCLECGKTIESIYTHDYNVCGCKNNASVDGGTSYLRYGANDMSKIKLLTLYNDDDFEQVRQHAKRGTRGKKMDGPLKWVPIKDLKDDHLKAILDYGGAEWHLDLIRKEIKHRENEKG